MNDELEIYKQAMEKRLLSGLSVIPYDTWKAKCAPIQSVDYNVECGDGLTVVDIQRFNESFDNIFGKQRA